MDFDLVWLISFAEMVLHLIMISEGSRISSSYYVYFLYFAAAIKHTVARVTVHDLREFTGVKILEDIGKFAIDLCFQIRYAIVIAIEKKVVFDSSR